MYSDAMARAAYTWRGTGQFAGRIDPPGIAGTGCPFEFSGHEFLDFAATARVGSMPLRPARSYEADRLYLSASRQFTSETSRECVVTGSLRALLEGGVRLQPELIVVQADAIGLTWRGLNEQARRVASLLVRDGVQLQDRLMYLGKNDPRFFEILFGCALAGAVFTPLNWRLAPRELAGIIADAKATVAFVEGDVRPASVDGTVRIVSLSEHETWQPLAVTGPRERLRCLVPNQVVARGEHWRSSSCRG